MVLSSKDRLAECAAAKQVDNVKPISNKYQFRGFQIIVYLSKTYIHEIRKMRLTRTSDDEDRCII